MNLIEFNYGHNYSNNLVCHFAKNQIFNYVIGYENHMISTLSHRSEINIIQILFEVKVFVLDLAIQVLLHTCFLVLANTFLEEICLALKRYHLHPFERVLHLVKLGNAQRE